MSSPASPSEQLRGRLILASASARRHQLLAETGLAFEIEPADVDESLAGTIEPEPAAEELALRKAREVARRHSGEECWVLGADTLVAVGEGPSLELLGKPKDEEDARRMLRTLSGSRHRVVTGVAWIPTMGEGGSARVCSGFERTWVHMRTITPEEVEAYVRSGEWRGKAGGYAIQENADVFVLKLEEGGFDNVVGLPVALTLDLLRGSGAFQGA
jgi:septum formation protein